MCGADVLAHASLVVDVSAVSFKGVWACWIPLLTSVMSGIRMCEEVRLLT